MQRRHRQTPSPDLSPLAPPSPGFTDSGATTTTRRRGLLGLAFLFVLLCGSLVYAQDTATTTPDLTPGEAISGTLTESDPQNVNDGSRYDLYGLEVEAGTTLALSVSGDVGVVLTLFGPDGSLIATSASALYGEAAFSLVESFDDGGRYVVAVSGESASTLGDYGLLAEQIEVTNSGVLTIPAEVTGVVSDEPNRYTLELDEARRVVIDMASGAFDTYLELYTGDDADNLIAENDDGPMGTDSQLTLNLEPGRYEIVASSLFGAGDVYTLSVAETAPLTVSGELSVPAEASGEISDDAAVIDGRPSDLYTLTLDEPMMVQIDLSSDIFDSYLTLRDDSEAVISTDDDGGSGRDSRLQIGLEPGSYQIVASSLFSDGSGAYTLSVQTFEPVELTPDADLTLPAEVSGELSADDATRDDGRLVDLYTLTLDEATTVQIDMISDPLDPYLYLETADGAAIAENDDGPRGTDSQIVAELAPGSYRILASSFFGGDTGPYTLSVQTFEEIELTSDADLTLPSEVSGELSVNDATRDGSLVDLYTLTLDEATPVRIVMSTEGFEPYVYLETADGEFIDGMGSNFGEMTATLREALEPGSYRVLAASNFDDVGPYTLSVEAFEPVELVPDAEITPPAEVTGELSTDDALRDDSYVDLYILTLDEPTTVVIDMMSGPIDPYLYLETADGTPIAENDDGPTGTDAQIREALEPGSYRILASSFFGGDTGPYTLRVVSSDSADSGGSATADGMVSLTVRSTPSGATVSLEGEPIGTTPIFMVPVEEGEQQTLRLELDGYETFEQPVDLVFDRTFQIRLTPAE
ncbi:MAG: PEGA domain-containing protein [Trueperaceae bacterium]|nr:PEGA domain-containing protein [Trueperaceae bacterium]